MARVFNNAFRQIAGLLPGVRAERRLRRMQAHVMYVEAMVQELRHYMFGNSAVYLGNNRVLVRIVAGTHLFMLYVHADDKLITPSLLVNGRYEPEVTDFLVRELRADSRCIDVGANLGYFSCLMGKHCPNGQVISLEPNPPIHALAVDNVLLNALHDQVRVEHAAASDRIGELTLFHRIGRAGNTSIAACGDDFTRAFQEPPEEPFQVATLRVDDLCARLSGRVDFLKVDVEGAEPLVLAGARDTIAGNPQLQIVMEWAPAQMQHAGFDIAEFVGDIVATGLAPHVIAADGLAPISQHDLVSLVYQPAVILKRPLA